MRTGVSSRNSVGLSIALWIFQLSYASAFVIKSSQGSIAFTKGIENFKKGASVSGSSVSLRVLADDKSMISDDTSTSTSPSAGDDLSKLLNVLDKRLKGGEGSLTDAETNTAIMASDNLLRGLEEKKKLSQVKQIELQKYSQEDLWRAATEMDVAKLRVMLDSGMQMDERTTNAAFWSVVNAVDQAEAEDEPLAANIPQMLHRIFDADQIHLKTREKQTTNLTCMQPDESDGIAGSARKMNYIFDDSAHKDLPLTEGRRCEGGQCCDKCSRNIFPTFASDAESSLDTFPELSSLTFNNLEKVESKTILQFVRLVERVRRTVAHEYGLPLSTILPLQAYSRKYVAGSTQKGGGGGEGDFVTLHTDEATHDGYHYSCVLYLSTHGVDFEGGNFVFNDPGKPSEEELAKNEAEEEDDEDEHLDALYQALQRGEELPENDEVLVSACADDEDEEDISALETEIRNAGRELTPFHPTRGAAVIFSSGWENMHEVEKITSGVRYAVPCFFTTCPVPDAAYEQMNVGKPKTDEDIADDWLHLLLAHRQEEPIDSVGRVKELLMKWHYICTPLTEH